MAVGSQFQSTVLLWWRTVNDAYRQRLSSDQFPWRRGGSSLGLGVRYILVEMPSSLSDRVPAYEEEEVECREYSLFNLDTDNLNRVEFALKLLCFMAFCE